jgi:hypothetical protein
MKANGGYATVGRKRAAREIFQKEKIQKKDEETTVIRDERGLYVTNPLRCKAHRIVLPDRMAPWAKKKRYPF